SSSTIAAGATTGTITLTASASAPAISAAAISITGTGAGVTVASQPVALSVTSANGATIALASATGSIESGRSGTLVVTVTRAGTFTGAVTVNATALPTGVTVASQTVAAGATTATLTFTTNLGAAAATTPLSVTATGSGITIAPQSYALTITAGPIAQLGNDMTSADPDYAAHLALNADGTRIIVSAQNTANGTTRVYERTGATWTQVGADIVGEASGDRAGISVAMNASGSRIAVGAYLNDDGGTNAGHIRVYDLVAGAWTQVGADINGEGTSWNLGYRVALNASGSRLLASGNERAKVYDLVSGAWTQVGNTLSGGNAFGEASDISSDGTTITVASASAAGSSRAGTVQVFRLVSNVWTMLGGVLQGEQISDVFGSDLSLSATGNRIAVSAPNDREGGVSGGGSPAGKVRVFDLVGGVWTQVGADIVGSTGLNGENLGETLTLSDDGSRLAATGSSQNLFKIFTLTSGAWVQTGPTVVGYGTAGRPVGLTISADGRTIAAGYINGTPRIARAFRITP
ncbi:MAG: hypothetical protein H7099_08695, partial [Gemmatimonadaceae bacterium]|nr:hypothetical protein [Gemmatimonadaceae bacterium]